MDYLNLVDPDAQHPLVAGVRMVADDQVPDFELILPNGRKLGVHKFLLAAFSSFWRRCFANRMTETETGKSFIHDDQGVSTVLAWIYNGEVCINMDELFPAIQLAHAWDVSSMLTQFNKHVPEVLSPDNMLDFWQLCNRLCMDGSEKVCSDFVLRQVEDVWNAKSLAHTTSPIAVRSSVEAGCSDDELPEWMTYVPIELALSFYDKEPFDSSDSFDGNRKSLFGLWFALSLITKSARPLKENEVEQLCAKVFWPRILSMDEHVLPAVVEHISTHPRFTSTSLPSTLCFVLSAAAIRTKFLDPTEAEDIIYNMFTKFDGDNRSIHSRSTCTSFDDLKAGFKIRVASDKDHLRRKALEIQEGAQYHVGWHDTMSRLCGREFEVVATLDKAKGVRIQDGFAVFALPFSGVEVVGVPRSLSRNSSPTSVGTGTGPNTLARHSTV